MLSDIERLGHALYGPCLMSKFGRLVSYTIQALPCGRGERHCTQRVAVLN
jgi:hypothetical protein